MPEPAGDRLVPGVLVPRVHPGERGGAGAAVEVLVGAADRDVGVRAGQVDRHRAGGVAQVPLHQRAGVVGGGGQRRQVEHRAGAEVDVGQREQRDVVVEGRRPGRPGRTSAARGRAAGRRRRRRTRRWGRWSAPAPPPGGPGRSREAATSVLNSVTVVESPTCTSSGAGADQRRDPGADAAGQVRPSRRCSTRDQARAPLVARPPAAAGRRRPAAARRASCRRGRRRPSGRANRSRRSAQRARPRRGRRRRRGSQGHGAHAATLGPPSAQLAQPVARPGPAARGSRAAVMSSPGGGEKVSCGDRCADPHEAEPEADLLPRRHLAVGPARQVAAPVAGVRCRR